MSEVGNPLSSEEHSPNALVEHARRAADVRLDFLSISDHYYPWIGAQMAATTAGLFDGR